MMKSHLYNYEIVRNTLEVHKDRFLRKGEIAELTGLSWEQVSTVIRAAWKLGWVSRIESRHCVNKAWGRDQDSCYTRYKIKRTDSWAGLMPLYHEVLNDEKNK